MLGRRHLRLCALALVALALAVVDAQLLLTLGPALLVAALPLAEWFLGEELIVAVRTRVPAPRARAQVRRAPPRSVPRRTPLCFEAWSERGPPVAA
jgi:hypothetical protein